MTKGMYRLWALSMSEQSMAKSLAAAAEARFSRVNADYVLIYAQKKPKLPCAEITEKDVRRLTKAEAQWLLDCGYTLFSEAEKKNGGNLAQSIGEKMDALEAALRRQKAIEDAEQNEDGEGSE